MKKLTYENYITAKRIISWLCEELSLVKKLTNYADPSVWDSFVQELEENDFDYFNGATKGCIWNKEDMPEWVIKFDLGDTDYCEVEYQNFRSAVSENFDCYLTTTKKIMSVDGITFYLAEYVSCDERETEDKFIDILMESGYFDSQDEVYDCLNNQDSYDRVVMVFNDYDFADWIIRRDINDLHFGNLGRKSDDSWVIIDYSGF